MKVLFTGVYRDGTGWGNAALNYIQALDAAGVDVVPRPIKLNGRNEPIPKVVEELERKGDKNCDIVIQNILPHMMTYNGLFDKNIALYFTETTHFRNTVWAEKLNHMDEGWVSCTDSITSSHNSYCRLPLRVIPIPADVTKYQEEYEPIDLPLVNDNFVFYHIGELNRRKNLFALLQAYYLEFRPNEPVMLVIKGTLPGVDEGETMKHMQAMTESVKTGLKLYNNNTEYPTEILISKRLTNDEIMGLHTIGDCLVAPSYGEAWNLEAFDSMAMGKTPICTDVGGMASFLRDSESEDVGGWLVPGTYEPVFGMNEQFKDLFVGNENWCSIDVNALRYAMRQAYENREEKEKRAEIGMNLAYRYSHANVGDLMKNSLEYHECRSDVMPPVEFDDLKKKIRKTHAITA